MLAAFLDRIYHSDELMAVFIAFVLSTIATVAAVMFRRRSRVGWSVSHQHAFNLPVTPAVVAFTREIWVQNVGREIADDVEVVLGFKPQHYDVWPPRPFQEIVGPDNSFTVRLENLNHREFVTISIFQTGHEPPFVNNVRWRGGIAKMVLMAPRGVVPRWRTWVAIAFMLLGFFSFWYFLLRLFF